MCEIKGKAQVCQIKRARAKITSDGIMQRRACFFFVNEVAHLSLRGKLVVQRYSRGKQAVQHCFLEMGTYTKQRSAMVHRDVYEALIFATGHPMTACITTKLSSYCCTHSRNTTVSYVQPCSRSAFFFFRLDLRALTY